MKPRLAARHAGMWVMLALVAGTALLSTRSPGRGAASRSGKLKTYPTEFYLLHTDLSADDVQYAAARLTAMAREYRRLTRAGGRTRPMEAYLFSQKDDYLAAGGKRASAGVFTGDKLMAVASRADTGRLWRVVQHEGFHQYCRSVISANLPVWVGEGLAEYYGLGIWTGDGFVTGTVPRARLARLRAQAARGGTLSLIAMTRMSPKEWNATLSTGNYDQAWAAVHFLVHAEKGRYRRQLSDFISDTAAGKDAEISLRRRFGPHLRALDKRRAQWWADLPMHKVSRHRSIAAVQCLTSFLARAHVMGQKFEGYDDFIADARGGRLKSPADSRLPGALLAEAFSYAPTGGDWSLHYAESRPTLVLLDGGPDRLAGTFTARKANGRWVIDVSVAVDPTPGRAGPTGSSRPTATAPAKPPRR